MKRSCYSELIKWKSSSGRLPLILRGARQTGKTYLLEYFGKTEFKNYHVVNFEKDRTFSEIFSENLLPKRIIRDLSVKFGKQIDLKNDLLIFDEVQMCPNAINSLKYFAEEMSELALCCAGSLLGVQLSDKSFPVGKVVFQDLYPMTFREFVEAVGNEIDIDIYNEFLVELTISTTAHNRMWELLKEYYYVGGMPQAVKTYVATGMCSDLASIEAVRDVQRNLIKSYYSDFAKHSGKINSVHISSVFENIPMQLSSYHDDSTKRFKFNGVLPKKKGYSSLEGPINWLEKAGLIIKVKVCNSAEIPLKAFTSSNIFKLYIFDIGLLGMMLEIPYDSLINQDYGTTKGFFAENYVANELYAIKKIALYSWRERTAEIEFIEQIGSDIIPIEVKSGKRVKARSLRSFIERYNPKVAIKISRNPLAVSTSSPIKNIPLYGIPLIKSAR